MKKNKFPTASKKLINWVKDMARLCGPDNIVWIDGSARQRRILEKEAVEKEQKVDGVKETPEEVDLK